MIHSGFYYHSFKFAQTLLKIKKKSVQVSSDCFHAAVLFSKEVDPDDIFQKKFLLSFRKLLPLEYQHISLSDIQFENLRNVPIKCSKMPKHFGKARKNNILYELSHFIMEPLHIFKGRGDHPLRGTLKFPIQPEQITLNVSKIPECPLEGHTWGKIINDDSIQWAGVYKDSMGNTKYMYPLQNDERQKFELARNLKKQLHKIRRIISNDLSSTKIRTRQKATAAYLIDKLWIRVGHAKELDSADTVGCCTLRVEHVQLTPTSVKFNFLGKDSIQFKRVFCPHELVLQNMNEFVNNKHNDNLIFDLIDAQSLNLYLNSLYSGLTAKHFRTCHASNKFNEYLNTFEKQPESNAIKYFKLCNAKIAKLCNHKRGNSFCAETSKTNYIDPRIVFAFAKKHNVDIYKLYSSSLQKRHQWAKNAEIDFQF